MAIPAAQLGLARVSLMLTQRMAEAEAAAAVIMRGLARAGSVLPPTAFPVFGEELVKVGTVARAEFHPHPFLATVEPLWQRLSGGVVAQENRMIIGVAVTAF